MGHSTEGRDLWAEQGMPKGLTPRLPRADGLGASPIDRKQPGPPRTAPELMTVPEAAQLLRMNPKALYALAAAGKMPGVLRLGRSIRIRRAALVGAGAVESVPVEARRLTGEQP